MKLTKSADFALRVVLKLASTQELQTMPQLSGQLSIAYNNLSKIVQQLTRAGIVQTKQGKNGGVLLAMTPDEISLKSVIDVIDGPTKLAECLGRGSYCELECNCKLKQAFQDIQQKIDTLFEDVKISTLVNTK